MLRVSQLYLNNVGPFTKQVFDFSIEEGHPDVHIFTGQNGSGKTTLLHAIASCFDFLKTTIKNIHLINFINDFTNLVKIKKVWQKAMCIVYLEITGIIK